MHEPNDVVVSSKELLEELAKAPKQNFFHSGNKYLDELIGGFAEGDLIVLGGTPKAGKTTLLQTLTRKFAEQNVPCMWFSIELSYRELFGRFGKNLPIFFVPRLMPTVTTHEWLEKKILEGKAKHGVKVVFVDHLGMITDESVARHQNNIDIIDARIQRLKRFAIKERVCVIAVATLQQQNLRKTKTEFASGDFRGTAMISYTADTLLAFDRLAGSARVETVNEGDDGGEFTDQQFLIPSDCYLYIVECRRTGVRKKRIKMFMNDEGDLVEA